MVQPYRAKQIKAIQYRHRIIWYQIQSNNLPTIEQTGANVSARGPRRALFASPVPSRDLRLWIATALVAIASFCGMGRLQPQDESARDANNASVVMSRLAGVRLFEHSAITDSATGDDGQAAVSNRLHCESGVLSMRYLRYGVPAEARCIDELHPGMSQASITFFPPVTKST